MTNLLEHPSVKCLLDNVDQVMLTAGYALEKSYPTPALMLTYSIIDTFGWLSSNSDAEPVGKRFVRFVTDWVLARDDWECTAIDLYGARCALLHRMASHSDHTETGKARRILYVYGATETKPLDAIVPNSSSEAFAKVSIDRLIHAVREGAAAFILQASNDEKQRARVVARSEQYYLNIKFEGLDKAIASEN